MDVFIGVAFLFAAVTVAARVAQDAVVGVGAGARFVHGAGPSASRKEDVVPIEPIPLTLDERHKLSVAAALRLTGRPDSSLEYVQAKSLHAGDSS